MPQLEKGLECCLSGHHIIGSELCLDCMFHNDTYPETETTIFCVFPDMAELMEEYQRSKG
jgi:hypothetical protein